MYDDYFTLTRGMVMADPHQPNFFNDSFIRAAPPSVGVTSTLDSMITKSVDYFRNFTNVDMASTLNTIYESSNKAVQQSKDNAIASIQQQLGVNTSQVIGTDTKLTSSSSSSILLFVILLIAAFMAFYSK